jgi:hypothetical protein
MKIGCCWLRLGCAVLALAPLTLPSWSADELPAYMKVIVAGASPAPEQTARQNILGLNTAMFGLYEGSGRVIRDNIVSQHPVILALFSGAGGRLSNITKLSAM